MVVVVVVVDVEDGTGLVVATELMGAAGGGCEGEAVIRRPRTCTPAVVTATELAPGVRLASPIAPAIRQRATRTVARRWRVMGGGRDGREDEVYEADTAE